MASTNKIFALILLLLVAAGSSMFLMKSYAPRTSEPQHALRLPEPIELPGFSLLDQDGNVLTNAWFHKQWTLVFFGFTHCPDICPATLQVLMLPRQQLAAANPDGELPAILLGSVDPDRDSPAILKQYVAHFGNGVSGATGPQEELQKLTRTLGVYFAKEESPDGDPGNYSVAHSAHVIVIDRQGDYSAVFSAPHTVDAFVSDMPLLMSTR